MEIVRKWVGESGDSVVGVELVFYLKRNDANSDLQSEWQELLDL